MAKYRKILVAIDLSVESKQVLETADSMRQRHDAELLVVHIVEPVSSVYSSDILIDEEQVFKAAKEHLAADAKPFNIEVSQQIVAVGHPQTEIHQLAKKHDIDLVVIGSHGRRGFQRLMLGSTANRVLHGATCDVLAVRVK